MCPKIFPASFTILYGISLQISFQHYSYLTGPNSLFRADLVLPPHRGSITARLQATATRDPVPSERANNPRLAISLLLDVLTAKVSVATRN